MSCKYQEFKSLHSMVRDVSKDIRSDIVFTMIIRQAFILVELVVHLFLHVIY